ncbi:MAG: phosphotransferase [Dehalococcoidia bacterium]|nr:phosphotransferase [Dehalococcoidia bacterium]
MSARPGGGHQPRGHDGGARERPLRPYAGTPGVRGPGDGGKRAGGGHRPAAGAAAGAAEAAIAAFAAFHALPVREGLDWGCTPGDLYPPGEVPLHRLGFAADERERAREPLLGAREALLASPFGLAHRDATAGNILLSSGQAWLTGFGKAGYGPQLFDVAAFLLTSGIEAAGRRALAAAYGRERGWEASATVDLVDLLGILWGIEELLGLPRKLIESLGDDAATAHLKLGASRIDKGMRQAAGSSPVAAAIRAALWPA